jgi:hypothetical protein
MLYLQNEAGLGLTGRPYANVPQGFTWGEGHAVDDGHAVAVEEDVVNVDVGDGRQGDSQPGVNLIDLLRPINLRTKLNLGHE